MAFLTCKICENLILIRGNKWWGDGDNTFIFTLTYPNALVYLYTAVTYFSHITHFFHPKSVLQICGVTQVTSSRKQL